MSQLLLGDKKKCGLIVGHTREKPGAVNVRLGESEFEFNYRLALLIENILANSSSSQVSVVLRNTYWRLPEEVNILQPDFCLSLHCNAYNKRVSGTQVLYYHTSMKSKALAEALQSRIVEALGLRDRGVVGVTSNGRGANILKNTKAPCIIAEPFFIDNDCDLKRAYERFEELARSYAGFIRDALSQVS